MELIIGDRWVEIEDKYVDMILLFNDMGLHTKSYRDEKEEGRFYIKFKSYVKDDRIIDIIDRFSYDCPESPFYGDFKKICEKTEYGVICNWIYEVESYELAKEDFELIKNQLKQAESKIDIKLVDFTNYRDEVDDVHDKGNIMINIKTTNELNPIREEDIRGSMMGILNLEFDDIESATNDLKLMNLEQANRIRDFIYMYEYEVENIFIACDKTPISSAIAGAISKYFTGDGSKFDKIDGLFSNQHCYTTCLKGFGYRY